MQSQTTIRCSSCGQPYATTIRNVIDVANDPQGKALLLAGQLNSSQCTQCGAVNTVSVPLLYHDAEKELLVALVPMELNMTKDQHERVVGDLMKSLPKENFKGYMFNPKRALTPQGLTEMILEADGITPEMMEEQRQRVNLIQQFIECDDTLLPAMVQQYDDQINLQFLQTVSLMAQRLAQSGRPDIGERIYFVQQAILNFSTFGKEMVAQQEAQEAIIETVADDVRALGEQATRADFLTLARQYADDDHRLQALVGLVRPAFDPQFLQELNAAITQAAGDEQTALQALRDKIEQFASLIDQQTQMQVQGAVNLLQALLNTPAEALDQHIAENIPLINDTFMAVLTANIEDAERRQDINASARLHQIYEHVVGILQQNMQPELVFINDLLSAESDAHAQTLLQDHAKTFGEPLLEVMDAIGEVFAQQGNQAMADRLVQLRTDAEAILSQ